MTSHDASKVSRTGGVLEPCGAAHGRRGGDIAAAAREGARQAVGPRAVTLSKHPAGTPDGRKMSERLKGVESRQESSHWRLPEPLAVCEAHGSDGASIILRRHGNPEGPRLVLSHANGLAADSYFPFWSLLCDRFDLVLYDCRNHGWNPVGDLQTHNIPTFVRDNASVVRAIDRYFGDKPKMGVFHSMSAVTAVLQAVEEKGFSALVLFDPATCAEARDSQDINRMASRFTKSSATLHPRMMGCPAPRTTTPCCCTPAALPAGPREYGLPTATS